MKNRCVPSLAGRSMSAGRLALAVVCALLATIGQASAGMFFSDDFSSDPVSRQWKTFGSSSLFHWNDSSQNLEVTWDSSETNSFFFRPLGTILTKNDDFSFAFDVRLSDIRYGTSAGKTDTFEIAIGLFNSRTITNANYFRGSGQNSIYGVRNLVEFDYFPDAGFGATFSSTVVSTNNRIKPAHNFPLEMSVGDLFHISLSYTASNQTLRMAALKNGAPYGLSPGNSLTELVLTSHPDFRVDAFGISSYSDAIQTGPQNFWGSVLAHGALDNVVINAPDPPAQMLRLLPGTPLSTAEFLSRTNWLYTLERSIDLTNWVAASAPTAGRDGALTIRDTNQPIAAAFYRIRAERP
jgi:hypothetical protein